MGQEISDWFVSADDIVPNETDNARKFDIVIHAKGPYRIPHGSDTPGFGMVGAIAEHSARQSLGQQYWTLG